ncbi:copper resistance CopC family protein [Nocardioides yefusunii]|uniref:Copper resistance protein CopC n=1 Tax=Nocardioides yefusunii TaxID=2500546 RepID=A0ABW1QUQ9_9ACTN|nr:copper resistance CopC family protein [Nocardioides yefusunii]
MNLLRTLALAVLAALASLVLPLTAAQAHSGLTGAVPSEGTTVDSLPDEVTLSFSEEVRAPAFVVITGPDRSTHEAGDPTLDGATVTQTFDAATLEGVDPNGRWTVAYRVVSADGHTVSGQTTFTVEGAEVPEPTPTSPPRTPAETPATSDTDPVASDDGHSGAPYLIAAVLALLLVTVAATSRTKDKDK